MDTFMRMQRVNQTKTRKITDAKDPQGFKQDLSKCIRVSVIKRGTNHHIKLAERKGYGTSKNEAAKVVNFDNKTLKDTQKII